MLCVSTILFHQNPEGLTAADLSRKCVEDKAAISRILSELEKNHFISYEESSLGKKYRAKVKLTLEGEAYARRISKVILKITERSSQGIPEEERKIFYRVLSIISKTWITCARNWNQNPSDRTLNIPSKEGELTHASTSETILPHLSAGT